MITEKFSGSLSSLVCSLVMLLFAMGWIVLDMAGPARAQGPDYGGYGGPSGSDNGDSGDEEPDYGGGYGGGYGGSASASNRSGANPIMPDLASFFASLQESPLLAPEQVGELSNGPALGRDAELAFEAGNLPLAMRMYWAHVVAEYEQAGEALEAVRFSPLLRRPTWHTRWGVSMLVRSDDDTTDFGPIPVDGSSTQRRARSSGGGSFAGGPGYGSYSDPSDDDSGDSGGPNYGGPGYGGPGYGGPSGGAPTGGGAAAATTEQASAEPATMLSESTRERFTDVLGLVAKTVENEFGELYHDGKFGLALIDIEPPPTPESNGRRNTRGAAPIGPANPMPTSADTPMWIPGVVFLGEGSSQESIETAREHGIEMLIHFDVIVKPTREKAIQNIARCRVLHVPSGKPLGMSKKLDSDEAHRLVDVGRTEFQEYVDERLSSLFEIVADKAAVVPMPELNADVARNRVAGLVSSQTRDLRALAEIRLYQSRGWLTDEEVENAFAIIGGDEALALLYGAPEDRLQVARQWVDESSGIGDES